MKNKKSSLWLIMSLVFAMIVSAPLMLCSCEKNTKSIITPSGQQLNSIIKNSDYTDENTSISSIIFDNYDSDRTYLGDDNTNMIVGLINEEIVCENGNLDLYRVNNDDGTQTILILSKDKIVANEDMSYAFWRFSSIKSISFNNFDTSKVIDMSNMFSSCLNLSNLDLSELNTSNVTTMSSMFKGCIELASINLSSFDTSNVTNMAGMFHACLQLNGLTFSNFDTLKVTDMSEMFYNCSSLEMLDLSNFNTSEVTKMFSMFGLCGKLIILDLTNFNTLKVNDMDAMFYNCSRLSDIYVGLGWNTDNVTTSEDMFFNCTSLPNYNNSTVDKAKAIVGESGYLTMKPIPTGRQLNAIIKNTDYELANTTISTIIFDYYDSNDRYLTEDNTNMIAGLKSEKITYSGNIDLYRLYEEDETQTVILLSNDEIVVNEDLSDMFYNFNGLQSIIFNNFNTANVTDMACMFDSCYELTTLDLSNFDTSNVADMTDMFYSCYELTTLDLSNFDTSKVENMARMFEKCSTLIWVDLSSFNMSEVEGARRMFKDAVNLENIYIGANWNASNIHTSSMMFGNCSKLPNFDEQFLDKAKAYAGEGGYLTLKTV